MSTDDITSNQTTRINKREYWLSQVKSWENSKLRQKAYCKKSGISYSSFVYWKSIFSSESLPKCKKNFLPINLASKSQPSDLPRVIQVKLLSGHSVYLPIAMGIKDISELLYRLSVQHA